MSALSNCILIAVLLPLLDACMKVTPGTPGMPAVPCKSCPATLITYSDNSEFHQEMNDDKTDTTGACAVRTFTCIADDPAKNAAISVNGGDENGGGDVTGEEPNLDRVIMPVTCNAQGTQWLYMGVPITQVECTYA